MLPIVEVAMKLRKSSKVMATMKIVVIAGKTYNGKGGMALGSMVGVVMRILFTCPL